MRIALLCHSYHKVTGSADFLADLLRQLGTVVVYFDESWAKRQASWIATFEPREFDCIVIFQAHECFQYLNSDHPNIVFIPMYDAMMWQGAFYWHDIFNRAKILCFSSALYREVTVRNPASAHFQYYPDPGHYPQVGDYRAPRGYYWRRRGEINETVIRRLTKGFCFEHFTVHNVPDPGASIPHEAKGPPVNTASYAVTAWLPSEGIHLRDVAQHNIYFAPRVFEGIGFAFLKAMSMGLCVVAPNTATHNEYIVQACTGVLYGLNTEEAADLRRYREIGLRARDSMERGRRRWEAKSEEFLEFIATPANSFQRRRYAVEAWIDDKNRTAPAGASRSGERLPSVAVVTVCLNAHKEIERTIRSVASQDFPGLEYIICDGASNDGTVEVIRRYEGMLAGWTSRPDGGVYQAMQESLDKVKSEWVLFMNAGDFFVSPDALRRLFANAPDTADVVYGHHIYRTTGGVDEVHFAADFAWTWSRLQAGEFDFECLSGFPGHQATAVRTRLLRELKFDPLFLITADHDLLWRAWRRGAHFFNADEIISVYLGGGMSAQQFERCKREWCVIALRYGPRKAALRFRARANADLAGAIELEFGDRGLRLAKWFSATMIGRMLCRMVGEGTLAKATAAAYSVVAKAIYLPFSAHLSRSDEGSVEKSAATPAGSLQFTRIGIPAFLSEARGLAEPEGWGVWTEGDSVKLIFKEQLPPSFRLTLHACAFGPNASAAIPVTVGSVTRQMAMKGSRQKKYQLDFSCHGSDRTITFAIPHPVAPAELSPGASSDRRRIGLGLVSMRIEPTMPGRQAES